MNKNQYPELDMIQSDNQTGASKDFFNSGDSPLPLRRESIPAEPYPVNALGEILSNTVKAIAHSTQAPLGICSQSVLAAVNLTVQAYADYQVDGRNSPISEIFITVAASGERKSAVDTLVLKPIRDYEKILRNKFNSQMDFYISDLEIYKKSKERILNPKSTKEKSQDEISEELNNLSLPVRPLDPFLVIDDITFEGLFKLLQTGRASLGLFSDEGGKLVGGHAMNQENILKTATGLSSLWDGKPLTRVRSGDGASALDGRRLSTHLMMQPNVADIVLSNDTLIGQGLISRCLLTWPDSNMGKRKYKEVNLLENKHYLRFCEKISSILKTPFPLEDEKRNELKPRTLILEGKAKKNWISFHEEVEQELGIDGKYSMITGTAAKMSGHAIRLASTLALFDDISCSSISVEHMDRGISLAHYYLSEAHRISSQTILSPSKQNAEKLLQWITKKEKEVFSLRDVYQNGPNSIRSMEAARSTIAVLEKHGFIVRDTSQDQNGREMKDVWKIRKFSEDGITNTYKEETL